MLINDGIPTTENIKTITPSAERFAQGAVAIAECFQEIPCNPCVTACKRNAITMKNDVNDLPIIDVNKCNGCGLCAFRCPGLAIFVVDKTYSTSHALVKFPFEYVPVPQEGQFALGLNRSNEEMGWFEVVKVTFGGKKNLTYMISLAVPQDLAMEVRTIRIGGYKDAK